MKRVVVWLAAIGAAAMIATPAMAHEAGKWIFRGGVGMVSPKSGNLKFPGDVPVGGGITLESGSIEVDDGTSLTLSGTYMFTENWALDILASAPFSHDIDVKATINDGVTSVSGVVPLGETDHLPPTFSVQYHFSPTAKFQPYVGLGLNWTIFFSEDLTSDAEAVGFEDISLDDSFGLAAQIGADVALNEKWLLNFDVRYIDIETDAKVTLDDGTGPVTGKIGTVAIDPWVYQINLGYRF